MVRLLQALLSAASCVLLAAAGARFFSPKVGMIAGVGLALYAPSIFTDITIQKSVVDLLLLTDALYLLSLTLDRHDDARRLWVGTGLLLGLLSLSRENALVLVVAVLAWAWLEHRDRTLRMALVAAGVAMVLLPVAARNGLVGGEWHVTTSQFGPNFYIGNHAGSDGTYRPLRYGRGDPSFERDDATALAEASRGRELTPSEVSRYWFGSTLTDIGAAPGRWFGLLGRKAALGVNRVEVMDTESQYAHADHSLPLTVTGWIAHFGLLIPLAALGVIATRSTGRRLTASLPDARSVCRKCRRVLRLRALSVSVGPAADALRRGGRRPPRRAGSRQAVARPSGSRGCGPPRRRGHRQLAAPLS